MGYFLVVCLPAAMFVVCCSLCNNSGFAKLLCNSCATAGGACEEIRVDLKAWVCPMSLLNHTYITGALGSQLKPWPVVWGSRLVSRWGGWEVPIPVLQMGKWSVERLHRLVEITEEAKGRITIQSRSREGCSSPLISLSETCQFLIQCISNYKSIHSSLCLEGCPDRKTQLFVEQVMGFLWRHNKWNLF